MSVLYRIAVWKMEFCLRLVNFWPINSWFDLGKEAGDVSKYQDIEHQFWFVMRIWVLVMFAGFAFGFWLLFCKAESVDPKIKKAHEEHIAKVLEARKVSVLSPYGFIYFKVKNPS